MQNLDLLVAPRSVIEPVIDRDNAMREDSLRVLIDMTVNSLDSPHTRRAYSRALILFFEWYQSTHQVGLSKSVVNDFKAHLQANATGEAAINLTLSAV